MNTSFEVKHAQIEWREGGLPFSTDFQDSYYSKAGGLAESQYIFIEQNNIHERCRAPGTIKIAEVGFGTGLNFLLTWKAWRDVGNRNCHLDYVAFEKFPLNKQDLARALDQWPEIKDLSNELLKNYLILTPGFIRIPFERGKINLTLIIGDALESMHELDTQYDAWYLDGFSPQKNADLWCSALCQQMQRLSDPGATFSTFTSAGIVRRNLQAHGFEVEKFLGFAHKRESLKGRLIRSLAPETVRLPWKSPPRAARLTAREVIVIGGGLAGYGVAHALCKQNFKVTILEESASGLGGASGNRAGIFAPYIARAPSFATELLFSSFACSLAVIRELEGTLGKQILNKCGAIQLLHTERLKQLYASLSDLRFDPQLVSASNFASQPALFLSLAGWIHPWLLCESIAEIWRDQLTVHHRTKATTLNETNPGWRVTTENGDEYQANSVVVCSAHHCSQFTQTSWIPLEPVRGELLYVEATKDSSLLSTVLMGKGYILPAHDQLHVVGADYAHNRDDLTPDSKVHKQLMQQAEMLIPSLRDSRILGSRASFRTSTHHRLPYVGPIVKHAPYLKQFADLHKGYPANHYPTPDYYPNLYISAGHGSRGLVSTLAAGEYIANHIIGTTTLYSTTLCGEMNPASYLSKKLSRLSGNQ